MNVPPVAGFAHLDRLCDEQGLFEHAEGIRRREEHGYCTDDNARLLVVCARETDHGTVRRLGRVAMRFVLDAMAADGRCRNRMDRSGSWVDEPLTNDCWGRAIWGLGATAMHHGNPAARRWALRGFDKAVRRRSTAPRSMAFAALGAAAVVNDDPNHRGARALLVDALEVIGPLPSGGWVWPERRLAYANATLAEAVIAAGAAIENDVALDRGLRMLAWLLDLETARGHLSVTGAGGRGPDEVGPQFDQQPIEAAAMADACWRAYRVTRDHAWLRGVEVAAAWFAGANDANLRMYDERSGGGFDGLHSDAVNLNQGAESTLAYVSTMQRARSCMAVR